MVGKKGDVRAIVPEMRVEVLDFDSLSSEEEVSEAVKRDFPDLSSDRRKP